MMISHLCRKMSQTPDPMGDGSLLDTSIILVMSENGQSANHGFEDVPWYILVVSGLFATGRSVDLQGRGSADLLWEIGKAMGLPWQFFGASTVVVPELYR